MFPMMGAGRASQRIEEDARRKHAERMMNDADYANSWAAKDLHDQGMPLRRIAQTLGLKQREVARLLQEIPQLSPYASKDD